MKRKLVVLLLVVFMTVGLFAQGSKASSSDKIKVGFVIRTLDSPYYVALAESIKTLCAAEGWDIAVLDSNTDTEKEAQNVDAFMARGVDLLFLDCVVPDPAVPVINKCAEAGIGVINLDSGVGSGAKDITTVYSDNEQNGRMVGLAYAEKVGKNDKIKAIMLSGNKGSVAGKQRRVGLFAGILEGRLGVSEKEAWKLAFQMEDELTSRGKAENKQANFIIAGQGWGAWTEEGGLKVAEDLITANRDLTCVLAENDQMNFGAITALANANIKNVDLVAAADGALRAYDLIKKGEYFATGENSPFKIAEVGVQIAREILIDGKDMWSYPDITMTEAIAVTKANVDDRYAFGF